MTLVIETLDRAPVVAAVETLVGFPPKAARVVCDRGLRKAQRPCDVLLGDAFVEEVANLLAGGA